MPTVIVVGAGIVGVTTAIELHRLGHTVTVLDPGPVPHPDAESTDISKLVRADYGTDDLYYTLMERAFVGWDEWNRTWSRPPYHQDGICFLGSFEPGSFEYEGFRRCRALGLPAERVDEGWLRSRHWRGYTDGYLSRRAGWAESGRVVAELARQARSLGVDVRQQRVERLDDLRADHIVVAAGTWTPMLIPALADRLWSTGQPVLHFRVANPADWQPPHFFPWAADIANTGWYGFPALDDGTVKIANHGVGVRIRPDGPREVPVDSEARFRAFLQRALPELAEAPLVRTRLCVYGDSFDGDFVIDRDPDHPHVIVAAGGSGHMFKFAPALGPLVAAVVEGRDDPLLARFRWRSSPSNDRGEQARARADGDTPG